MKAEARTQVTFGEVLKVLQAMGEDTVRCTHATPPIECTHAGTTPAQPTPAYSRMNVSWMISCVVRFMFFLGSCFRCWGLRFLSSFGL